MRYIPFEKNKIRKFISLIVCTAITITCLNVSAISTQAASSGEIRTQINMLQKERTEIQNEMEKVKKQHQDNQDEIGAMIKKKNQIDQEIGLLHTEIINIEAQVSAYNQLIADKQGDLDHAQENLQELQENTKLRIRTIEEEGTLSYWEVLFQANSFSDLLDRINMIDEIASADKVRIQTLTDAAETVSDAKSALDTEKQAQEAVRQDLVQTGEALTEKRKEADDLIAELISRGVELEDLHSQFDAENEALLEEISQLEKAYQDAKHQEWLDDMVTAATQPSVPDGDGSQDGGDSHGGGNTPSSGGWIMPCHYVKLTSPFGHRDSPTSGASTFHQGVDLSAPAGTPIYASRSGVVTTARYGNAAGYYVTITHGDGFSSIYMHMTNYIVSVGQTVAAGQTIGYVGRTGIATGNHLHFGIAYNGAYVNPASYLSFY